MKQDTPQKALRRWFKPSKALGWAGVKWFRKDQANELIGALWQDDWYVVRSTDLKPGVAERYSSEVVGI